MSAFDKGYEAGFEGGSILDCPFEEGTQEAQQWEMGLCSGEEARMNDE